MASPPGSPVQGETGVAEVFTAEPTLQARNRTPPRIKNGGINKMRIPLFNTAERAPCCAAAVR